MRQTAARQSVSNVMRRAESRNLYRDFERLGDKVEQETAAQRAYETMAEGELTSPENIARQKLLLHKVIRAMLIS